MCTVLRCTVVGELEAVCLIIGGITGAQMVSSPALLLDKASSAIMLDQLITEAVGSLRVAETA